MVSATAIDAAARAIGPRLPRNPSQVNTRIAPLIATNAAVCRALMARTALGRAPAGMTAATWIVTPSLQIGLDKAGYRRVTTGHKFFVTGMYGPLRDGELEAARAWGSELAQALQDTTAVAAAR